MLMSEYLPMILEDVPDTRLPVPDEISYYKLEKERMYFMDYDVDEPCMELERMIIRWNMEDKGKPVEERKPIRVFIHSSGGYAYYTWSLIDTILMSTTPVYTINVGYAMSAAGLIFLAGHKRFMFPRAKVLIHQGQNKIEGDAQKVMDQTAAYKKELKEMQDYIVSRTAIPATTLTKKKNNDWEIDAQFCLENKVCHAIVNNLDEVL